MGDDGAPHTTAEMADRLVMTLAGAAAEDAVLGSVSTAAEDDIGRATGIARMMVGRCGMSEAVGRVRVLASSPSGPDGDGSSLEAVSPATVEAFDQEVRRLVGTAEARAKAILNDNRSHLDAMVARLKTEEILERDALAQLLSLVVAAPRGHQRLSDARARSVTRRRLRRRENQGRPRVLTGTVEATITQSLWLAASIEPGRLRSPLEDALQDVP